jgi:type I restriction enzyme, S subunit
VKKPKDGVALDEIGKVGRGKSKNRPRNEPSLYGGDYPFIQTGDIKHSNLYITQYTQTYNEKGLAQSKLWDPGTLCITIAANIAETAILSFPACFPDSVIGFIPNKEKSDVRFIKYCMDTYKIHMQAISQGTTQDNLSLEKLLSVRFKIPLIPIQQKIAGILSCYDDLIENNNKRIALLERAAEEIYSEWFIRMRFPGWKQVKFMKGVPLGWEIMSIGSICSQMNSGGTPSRRMPNYWTDGTINWFKTGELQDGFLYDSEEKITDLGLQKSSARIYEPGTIMMAIYGSPTVGRLGIVTEKSTCNQATLGMNANLKYISNQFLFYKLKEFRDYFNSISQGAAQQNISKEKVYKTPCLVPSKNVVDLFDETIFPLWKNLNLISQTNKKYKYSRDLLLSRLVSGRLPVEGLDIRFPSSMQTDVLKG